MGKKARVEVLTIMGSLLLLTSSFLLEPTATGFWSCGKGSEASLNEPGNLPITFGTSIWEELDLFLRSSVNILLLAATKPDIPDKSAPFEIFGASSGFLVDFAHAAR